MLERDGWKMRRQKGSHMSFKKGSGEGTLTLPLVSGRKVKRAYLDQIIERLSL